MNKTTEFNTWLNSRLDVAETFLHTAEGHCQWYLADKKMIHKEKFESEFQSAYCCINEDMEDAQWRAVEDGVSSEVLDDAIKSFKQKKAKIRKRKAEYKKAFEALLEEIEQAKKDVNYTQKAETVVEDVVKDWCSCHTISCYYNDNFTGERLKEQIQMLTNNALATRLYTNDDDLRNDVEAVMKQYTSNIA